MKKEFECSKEEKCKLHITRGGLASTLEVRCTYRSERCKGHSWAVTPPSNPNAHPSHNKTYDINKCAILAGHQAGMGWTCAKNLFSILGVQYLSQTGYESAEQHVGAALMQVRREYLEEAMEEKKQLTTETYSTEEAGELPACKFGVDLGWNKKESGRTYNSATGTLNATGVRSGKTCGSQTLCKSCHKCDKLEIVRKKKEKAVAKGKTQKIKRYTTKEKKLADHKCMKNWGKSSKSMESETIVQLVLNAPRKSGMYVRGLVMDDDTTTPAKLGEDTGSESKGRLPKNLT